MIPLNLFKVEKMYFAAVNVNLHNLGKRGVEKCDHEYQLNVFDEYNNELVLLINATQTCHMYLPWKQIRNPPNERNK